MGWTSFLLAYLLGGVTFFPLIAALVFFHAYLVFPRRELAKETREGPEDDDLVQPGDDVAALKAAQKDEAKSRPSHHDYDVAAGYFAVCREYTPMGINAKPIERATPVGSTTVAAPSPSVYQAMYRSIFDRKQGPGPLDNGSSNSSQRPKRAGNVFYVVLRHGHLMLFDDDEQLEVRHVISLAHHDVSIYSGGDKTPEGELFIKRNAICLARNTDESELSPDGQLSKPFFLFSENCSAKEDFYFALLKNQEQTFASGRRAHSPLNFEVKHIIGLVQKLHYSEEHLQTRWLNALIGRLFLGVYKTKDVESFIREKLTKKISRVKRPSFLSNIEIKAIDTGESAPYITNPRLKDLTVAGECGVEADLRYTGNFRLEVAATARIELGTRFKPREVNLVLSVVVRKVEGRAIFKIKPPPSNRLWLSFQQMPKVEMTIEPIVSSRQITYTLILRQIENRIKEVIAETMVLPFWDDTPFFRTEHKHWRGGIFAGDDAVEAPSLNSQAVPAQAGGVDTIEQQLDEATAREPKHPSIEKSYSLPIIEADPPACEVTPKKASSGEEASAPTTPASPSASSVDTATNGTSPLIPRIGRSASLVNPSAPVVGTDATNADVFKPSSSPPDRSPAATAIAHLSSKSQVSPTSHAPSPIPFKPYITSKSSNHSTKAPPTATDIENDPVGGPGDSTPQSRRNTVSSLSSREETASLSSLSTKASIRSQTESLTRGLFSRKDTSNSSNPSDPSSGGNEQQKRTALAAVTNAAVSAKRWGLNAIQRHNEGANSNRNGPRPGKEPHLDLNQPMGRGRPLPPPGIPLPMPDKKTKTAPIPVPKRHPLPPPPRPGRQHSNDVVDRRPVPPPPLPRRREADSEAEGQDDGILVVAAPADSEPTTPLSPTSPPYVKPWVEDADDGGDDGHDDGEYTVAFADEESNDPWTASDWQASSNPAQLTSMPGEKAQPGTNEGGNGGEEDDFSAWMDDEETANTNGDTSYSNTEY